MQYLGSTGSIGTQTLEVVRENRDIEVTALAAGSNIELLEEQIREFSPCAGCSLGGREGGGTEKPHPGSADAKVVSGMDGLIQEAAAGTRRIYW